MKRNIKSIIRHLKVYKFDYLNKILSKILIVAFVIVFALILKKINYSNTNIVLEKIHDNIMGEFNLIDQGYSVFKKAEDIVYSSSEFIRTFNEESIDKLSSPIKGRIYRGFQTGVNEGIDILSIDGKDPLSITQGIVKEVKVEGKKGYFVIVESDNILITYGYLSKAHVSQGDIINVSDPIGTIGKNKDHNKYLRLEMQIDEITVDPEKYIEIKNSLSI